MIRAIVVAAFLICGQEHGINPIFNSPEVSCVNRMTQSLPASYNRLEVDFSAVSIQPCSVVKKD